VYAYLPPQYFQPGYGHYRFPVVELIHGQPGVPQDWINVVGVTATMDDLVNRGLAKPAVLVMPDANGGQRISLQCLNQHDGPQDMTYLGLDVPNGISRMLRVQPPGLGWGLAGYSEGGFCAANMALQPDLRRRYGMAASLSGYFSPFKNLLADGQAVDPFGGNKALRRENTPLAVLENLSPGSPIPQFWLGAGKGDKTDVAAAEYFWQELQIYQANVPLVLMPGQHTMAVWRAEVSPMLEWMTDGLASAVAKLALNVRLASKHAPQCAKLPAVRSKLAAHARRDPSTRSRAGHSVRSTSPAACRRTLPSRAKFQVKHQTQASAIARANAQTRT
jgi:enterochelin esterase-like enzyme